MVNCMKKMRWLIGLKKYDLYHHHSPNPWTIHGYLMVSHFCHLWHQNCVRNQSQSNTNMIQRSILEIFHILKSWLKTFFPDAIFTCPYLCSLWGTGTKILHNFGHKTVWIGFETFEFIFFVNWSKNITNSTILLPHFSFSIYFDLFLHVATHVLNSFFATSLERKANLARISYMSPNFFLTTAKFSKKSKKI